MAGLLDELVSGVVDAALKEVLKKTGVRKTTTTRKKASGGILGDIIEAALKPAKKTAAKRPRKQTSRRRTAASRSRQRSS